MKRLINISSKQMRTEQPKSTSSTIFKLTLGCMVIMTTIKLFENALINSVFIFFYTPIILFGYLALSLLLLGSIIYWVRQRNKAHRPFIPFIFSISSIIFILYFPFNWLTLEIDFRLNLNEREKVVKMIADKTIAYDLKKSSRVTIPTEYTNLSAGSANVIVEIIDNTTCVFFYTFRGMTDNSAGFVYVPDEKIMSKFKLWKWGASYIFYNPREITKITENCYFIANS